MYQIHATKLEVLAKSPLKVERRIPPSIPKGVVVRPDSGASTSPNGAAGPSTSKSGDKRKQSETAAQSSAVKKTRQSGKAKAIDSMDE